MAFAGSLREGPCAEGSIVSLPGASAAWQRPVRKLTETLGRKRTVRVNSGLFAVVDPRRWRLTLHRLLANEVRESPA